MDLHRAVKAKDISPGIAYPEDATWRIVDKEAAIKARLEKEFELFKEFSPQKSLSEALRGDIV